MVKWEFIKTSMISLAQAFWKKDVKARKWRQKQYLMDLTSLSAPGCFDRLQGENNIFGVENRKNKTSNIFFFLIKSSTSDLNALTILDHACKIIKRLSSTQTSEMTFSDSTSLQLLPYYLHTSKGLKKFTI